MTRKISLHEKYSSYWPLITYSSIILALILFTAYLFSEGVLLSGYLRLFAFIFFAAGVFGLFKMKDGKVKMIVEINESEVISRFFRNGEQFLEESWNFDQLQDVQVTDMPNKNFYYDFVKSSKAVRVKGKKDDSWLYFNKISNRIIPLEKHQAEALKDFLKG
jgi:hypothetical protein